MWRRRQPWGCRPRHACCFAPQKEEVDLANIKVEDAVRAVRDPNDPYNWLLIEGKANAKPGTGAGIALKGGRGSLKKVETNDKSAPSLAAALPVEGRASGRRRSRRRPPLPPAMPALGSGPRTASLGGSSRGRSEPRLTTPAAVRPTASCGDGAAFAQQAADEFKLKKSAMPAVMAAIGKEGSVELKKVETDDKSGPVIDTTVKVEKHKRGSVLDAIKNLDKKE